MPKPFFLSLVNRQWSKVNNLPFGQDGFSSLGLFLMVMVMLIIMSSTGFFTPPKSLVDDKNVYQPDEEGQANAKSLQFTDIKFYTPTPSPTSPPTPTNIPPTQGPTETPQPIQPAPATATPGPPPTKAPPLPTRTPTPVQPG